MLDAYIGHMCLFVKSLFRSGISRDVREVLAPTSTEAPYAHVALLFGRCDKYWGVVPICSGSVALPSRAFVLNGPGH